MPPEPLPLDSKDLFTRDKKHERGSPIYDVPGGGGGSSVSGVSSFTPRWRESYQSLRDLHSPSPRRPLPGHYKQGGGAGSSDQLFPDEIGGHGCTPSRSEDDSFRACSGRYGGRNSSSRESRGSFQQSPRDSVTSTQRLVADALTRSSSQPLSLKDNQDKNVSGVADGLVIGHRCDRERDGENSLGSIARKPLMWSRSGSFSSSSKLARSESDEGRLEVSVPVPTGKETPVRSPVESPLPSERGCPRKKPRLGWGQGLAKYEKQKVEGPEDAKANHSDASPKLNSLSGSASPATPSSVACSSSRGMEDRPFTKAANNDITSQLIDSPVLGFKNYHEDLSHNLEHLEDNSLDSLSSLLADLLQPEDASSEDSNFTRQTALKKLHLLKIDVLKVLEKTEGDIDLSENELKNLNGETNKESLGRDGVLEESHVEVAGQNIDCPEAATSRLGKPDLLDKVATPAGTSKLEGDAIDLEKKPSAVCGDRDRTRSGIDGSVTALIMASNRDCAKRASEVFDKAFPVGVSRFDAWGSNFISTQKKDLRIKEKLAMRKCFLRFKARVLSLKYRAFSHLWKEDLRLLSIRKHRSKSHKRFDLNCRSSQNASQKHRPSIRLRFTLPGNVTLVPTTEILDFTSKLLSDAKIKLCRSNLKMPALILDERESRHSRFVTNNGLIEDPCAFEKERTMINPWTFEEKEVFLEKLAFFGKDFTKIASFLDHKTTADCVEFYYKNHKSESFEKVKQSLDLRKQWQSLHTNTYLVTRGLSSEMNAASIDLPGEASMIAANVNGNMRAQQKVSGRPVFGAHNFKVSVGSYGAPERASSVEISGHEKDTSAAMSSCITSSVEPMEKLNYMTVDQPLTSEVTQYFDDEETCSDEGCGELDSVDWTDEEKSIFIRALSSYGKDFTRISRRVQTRSREQCKIFFSKARKCLGLDAIHHGPGNEGATPLSDGNEGRSDTDDACIVEMDSTICSTQSCSKVDVESVVNNSCDRVRQSGAVPLQTDHITSSGQYDVGVAGQEPVDIKVEKLESIIYIDDKKTVRREEVALSEQIPEEVPNDGLGCNHSGGLHEAADLFSDVEVKQENALADSASEFGSTEGLDSNERLNSHIAVDPKQEDVGSGFPDELKAKLKAEQFAMAEKTGLDDRQFMKTCTAANNNTSFQVFPAAYSANGTTDQPGNKVSFCPSVIFSPNYHHQIPQRISWKQKGNSSSSVSTLSSDQSYVHYEEHCNEAVQSTINFEEHCPKRLLSSLSGGDVHQRYLLGNQSLTLIDQPANILRGYPLRLLKKKEVRADPDMICKKSVLPQIHLKQNGNPPLDQVSVTDKNCEKSHGRLGSGLPCIGKGSEQSDAQLRPCSWSDHSESEEHSVRTGDVKLFGQILSPPSSLHKANSSSHEIDDKPPSSPKLSNSSSASLPNGRTDETRFPSRPGGKNCYLDLDELPRRSYGFWDGNRIQTGLASLPESAMILTNYPGALAGVSYFPTKDGSPSNRVLKQAYIQPLAYDRKHHDVFTDACNHRNGFETVPCYQQQGSVGKAGGILVGGGCTGISDPVVAIKMHYAGRAGVHGSEEESWRDIGQRM